MSDNTLDSEHVAIENSADNSQRPVKQSCCASLVRDTHWKCLTLSLIIWLCLSFVIWCQVSVRRQMIVDFYHKPSRYEVTKSPCENGYHYIPMAFAIMFYLIYLVEVWNCHTRIELTHKVDASAVYEHVKRMQEALPFVWWKVICYHYIRRTRQVTRYRNGDAFTSTQVYYERVNSYTTGSAYNFAAAGCRDLSHRLTGLEHFPATKIRFTKGFSFQCPAAEMEFESQRSDFFHENEARDDYMECREGMDLMNMRPPEYVIAMCDSSRTPWYLNHGVFLLASLLLFSWPLRVIIEYKTAYLHYHIHKVFGENYIEDDTPTSRMPNAHRRPVSITSAELDYFISTNLMQLPSYSEALLMPLPERSQHHRQETSSIDNEGLLIANPLCRSNTVTNWQWQSVNDRRLSAPTDPPADHAITPTRNTAELDPDSSSSSSRFVRQIRSLSPRWIKQLRRNTSDSFISRYCIPRVPTSGELAVNNISTIDEHSTANHDEVRPRLHPHPHHMQRGVAGESPPGYEEALFLMKIPADGLGRLAGTGRGVRRSLSRQFRSLTRSRSAALVSNVTRGLRRLSRSRSDYQCIQGHTRDDQDSLPLTAVNTRVHYSAQDETATVDVINPSYV